MLHILLLLLQHISLLQSVFQVSTILIFKLILIILASCFYKATSFNFNYACKGERWTWKSKEAAKHKAVLPSLSSDDDHDEYDDATPDVPITSTHTTPPESPEEPTSKKSKKMRQLTAEEEDDMS